jgi:excisionase family DNA binding protein
MERNLLTPREVDVLLRYPRGRTLRLAKAGRIPCVRLPDGEIRIDEADLEALLRQGKTEGASHAS